MVLQYSRSLLSTLSFAAALDVANLSLFVIFLQMEERKNEMKGKWLRKSQLLLSDTGAGNCSSYFSSWEQDLKMVRGAKDLSLIYRTKLAANRLSQSKVYLHLQMNVVHRWAPRGPMFSTPRLKPSLICCHRAAPRFRFSVAQRAEAKQTLQLIGKIHFWTQIESNDCSTNVYFLEFTASSTYIEYSESFSL